MEAPADDLPAAPPLAEAPCVDRVNVEPAILLGLSSSEAVWTIAAAFAVWVPVGVLAGLAARSMAIGVLFATVTPLVTVYVAAMKMAAVKRDRPDLYYLHLFRQRLARHGLRRSRFVTHAGGWDLGRSLPPQRVRRRRRRGN
jgi:conjugative transfer region protein (TIGR03750 family)